MGHGRRPGSLPVSQSGPRSCLGSPESIRDEPCPSLRIPESSRAVPTQCLRLKPAVPTGQPRQHTSCVNMPAAPTGRLRSGPASATGLLPQRSERQAAPTGPLCQQAGCGAAPTDPWANRPAAPKHRAGRAERPAAQRAGCANLRRQAGSDYPPCAWNTWHGPTERARLRVRTTVPRAYAAHRGSRRVLAPSCGPDQVAIALLYGHAG